MIRFQINRDIIACLFLIFICLLVFSNTLTNPFMWDDNEFIAQNRYIRDLKYIPYFFMPGYWSRLYSGGSQELKEGRTDYRPISMSVFTLDYRVWRLNPFGYHITNIILHIINVILIYFLIKMLKIKEEEAPPWPSAIGLPLLASLLFAVHPIHTESVSWIKNRSDLLTLLFFLLSFMFFIRYSLKKQSLLYYIASIPLFLMALLSKAMAVVLPFILLSYALYFLPGHERKSGAAKTLPLFLIAALYLLFKKLAFGGMAYFESASKLQGILHIAVVFKTIGYYLGLLLIPVNLSVERPFTLPQNLFEMPLLFSAVSITAAIFFAIWTFRRSRLLSFMALWVLVTLIPVSNIIYLYERPIAEQRLYIPSLGFCAVLAMAIRGLASVRSGFLKKGILKDISAASFLCVLILYSTATIRRNFDWREPVIFWQKTSQASPVSPRAYNNLGMAYAEAGSYHEAIKSYKKAIELNPYYAQPYNNLGKTYSSLGMDHEAIALYEKAIETDPGYTTAHYNLATAYYNLGKRDDAIVLYRKAIGLNPYYEKAYLNLGAVYSDMGRYGDAVTSYKTALDIDPHYAAAYNNLAMAYLKQGEYRLAVEYFNKAKSLGVVNPALSEDLKPYME